MPPYPISAYQLPSPAPRRQSPNWEEWPQIFNPPQSMFAPGEPLHPVEPEQVRSFDFPVGVNQVIRQRFPEVFTFSELKAFANVELCRLAIETRKDQIERLDWQIRPRAKLDSFGRPKASRKDSIERIKSAEKFFSKPNQWEDFHTWMRIIMEDLLVLDAPTFELQRTRGGDLAALQHIPGDTIKVLVDHNGRRPSSPAPAYQQIIKGRVWANLTEDDIVYAPRNPRSGKLYGFGPVEQCIVTINTVMRRQASQLAYFCYSDDTEVLTKRGWLRFADTTADDEFATRRAEVGVFEWQKPYDTFRKPYRGDMLHFSGKRLDQLVTPNHKMLVAGNAGSAYQREYVMSAEDLAEYKSPANTAFILTSEWHGTPIKEVRFDHPDPRSYPITMSGDDYCAFMGMYLAEGSTRRRSISIAQPKDDERGARSAFEELLNKIFGYREYNGERAIEVGSVAMVEHLKQFGHAHEKFIPDIIREATPRQLRIFWEYYYLGDGRADPMQEKRGKAYSGTPQCTTVSSKLADQLCEIGQKLGFAPVVWVNPARLAVFGGRTINCRENYVVSFSKKPLTKHWDVGRIAYDGEVHCVSVPNGFLYVRRNGKACWSGNSDGTVPAGMATVPDGWTVDQTKEWQEWMDSVFSGNLAERRKLLWAPAGAQYQAFKEAPIKDDFDEWLARIICYCFSLPPTPFIRQMNRSTAQSDTERALEEGLAPLLVWSKRVADNLLWNELDFRDLEFTWGELNEVDLEKRAGVNNTYVRAGVLTINEVRETLGMDPVQDGDTPLIYTNQGALTIEMILNQPDPLELAVAGKAQPSKPANSEKTEKFEIEDDRIREIADIAGGIQALRIPLLRTMKRCQYKSM